MDSRWMCLSFFWSSSSLHSRCCRLWSRQRLMLHLHPSILLSLSPPPSFHYLLPPWTCCLGLFKVIGSCPSSSCGQLGSEVSDLFLIGWNGMVIVALCWYSVENKEVSVSKVCGHTFSIPNIFYFHAERHILLQCFLCMRDIWFTMLYLTMLKWRLNVKYTVWNGAMT